MTEGDESFHLTIDPASIGGDLVFGIIGGTVVTIMDDDSMFPVVAF